MSKHYMFVSIPNHGHVIPTLPLVEELVRRGHRVTYATHEKHAAAIASTGATHLPTPGIFPFMPPEKEYNLERLAFLIGVYADMIRDDLPILVDYAESNPPDAVCYDVQTPAGRMLADKVGAADVLLAPVIVSNEHFSVLDTAWAGGNTGAEAVHPAMAEVAARLQAMADDYGVPVPSVPILDQTASLNLVFIPREFQPRGETFDSRYHFVGPTVDIRTIQADWEPPSDGRPLVYVSLGTEATFNLRPDFFRMCMEAFTDTPWSVAIAIGEYVDPADLGEIPPNVEVRRYFPQATVLKHASAFISHAGMGSVMHAASLEVPLVAVPQLPEQAVNGGQVQELGLGTMLDPTAITPELLRSTVLAVSNDPAIKANLAEMGPIVRGSGGPISAADALEKHLTG